LLAENTELRFDLANWAKLAKIGSTTAVSGLSQMVNKEFTVTALNLEEVSTKNASTLIGKADDMVIGVYLLFSGNANGHILLAFKPEIAFELVDMAMGSPSGSTNSLGEMERSVLGEMGNIVGSFFLNGVADSVGLRLMPSPPAVVEDMAGALIGSVLVEAFRDNDSLFVIKLLFSTPSREIEGKFLVLPSFDVSANESENKEN
jgi:chemotaxis protein CheC